MTNQQTIQQTNQQTGTTVLRASNDSAFCMSNLHGSLSSFSMYKSIGNGRVYSPGKQYIDTAGPLDKITFMDNSRAPPVHADSSQIASIEPIKRRIYRACVHCRQRKSKCDLDSIDPPGKPPCKRCVRENRECVLAGSRRGGRRERKPKLEDMVTKDLRQPDLPENPSLLSNTWPLEWSRGSSPDDISPQASADIERRISNPVVDKTIAAKDIQNPSDALEILAQVAGDVQVDSSASSANAADSQDATPSASMRNSGDNQALRQFPPVAKGLLNYETMNRLLAVYRDNYHLFFPICPLDLLDVTKAAYNAQHSPHLFCAILTIASADSAIDLDINKVCVEHSRRLVADLIYGTGVSIQAVEALLILAEWAVWNQHEDDAPGKGREDASAWLLSGTAIRLGYLLGLDRTSFRNDDSQSQIRDLHRRRLVWTACYMSDRQVSIRVGRGFWSRGPGPLSVFQASDFPTLNPVVPGGDDYATIFKANLELTQLFGNVHDILYSNRGREMKLILVGDYVKYIDDFRTGIRSWHSVFGTLTCSPRLKISLLLSFDYLRLYVNAFAFQAAMARMISGRSETFTAKNIGLEPDARFVYESVDAAKSILTTVNNFVDPVTCLRYLPLKYFLYIIHAAVFLYKAMSTDTMSSDEKDAVQRMVVETTHRLQKAADSSSPGHLSSVYARLISLLWQQPAAKSSIRRQSKRDQSSTGMAPATITSEGTQPNATEQAYANTVPPGFSWLDLASAADFATSNGAQDIQPYFQEMPMIPNAGDGLSVPPDGINLQQWFNEGSPNLMF